jgi:hypothetical protein
MNVRVVQRQRRTFVLAVEAEQSVESFFCIVIGIAILSFPNQTKVDILSLH